MTETIAYAVILFGVWLGISFVVSVIVGKAIQLSSEDENR